MTHPFAENTFSD